MRQISARELADWLADDARPSPVLLDVREDGEFAICRIEGSVHMPMHTIPARIDDLDEEATIVCICHHGARSLQVAAYLERNGFGQMVNLTGGVHAWALQVDDKMATY